MRVTISAGSTSAVEAASDGLTCDSRTLEELIAESDTVMVGSRVTSDVNNYMRETTQAVLGLTAHYSRYRD